MFRRAFYLLCASHKVVSGRPELMRTERTTSEVHILRAYDSRASQLFYSPTPGPMNVAVISFNYTRPTRAFSRRA